jgi:hypothetical protein
MRQLIFSRRLEFAPFPSEALRGGDGIGIEVNGGEATKFGAEHAQGEPAAPAEKID